jgi:hypothetical protein
MAVEHIHEIWKGRDADGQLDDVRYTRLFRIFTTSGADDGTVVGNALAAAPWNVYPGATHPNDPRAYCIGARPQNDLGPRGWICAASYSTRKELAAAPENDHIEIDLDEEDIDVPVVKDRDGKAVTNSAGDFPAEPVMAQDSLTIARIECNVVTIPAYALTYRKSINSDTFTIEGLTIGPKKARLRRMKLGKKRFRATNPFRSLQIELALLDDDDDDWEIRFADRGFRKKVTSGGGHTYEKILSDDGTEPTDPPFLNGSGAPLANPTIDNIVYREVGYYKLKTFGGVIPGCVAGGP